MGSGVAATQGASDEAARPSKSVSIVADADEGQVLEEQEPLPDSSSAGSASTTAAASPEAAAAGDGAPQRQPSREDEEEDGAEEGEEDGEGDFEDDEEASALPPQSLSSTSAALPLPQQTNGAPFQAPSSPSYSHHHHHQQQQQQWIYQQQQQHAQVRLD